MQTILISYIVGGELWKQYDYHCTEQYLTLKNGWSTQYYFSLFLTEAESNLNLNVLSPFVVFVILYDDK